jgi:phage baseplate assembly protein W
MTPHEVRDVIGRAKTRGATLSTLGQRLVDLSTRSSLDLSSPLGASLLIAQGYAKAVEVGCSTLQADPGYVALPLALQGDLARQAVLWAELRAGLGAFAFQARWPLLDTVLSATPGARWFGSNSRGVELSAKLESLTNAPAMAGVSVDTFWAMTPSARTSLGRLVSVDLVLTRTYDFSLIGELLVLLTEGAPLLPDVDVLLARVDSVRAATYREAPIRSVRAVIITEGDTLQDLAQKLLGSSDAWPELAQANSLRFPYLSDEPVAQLGDVQGHTVLQAQAVLGSTVLTLVSAAGLYVDQRIRLDNGFDAEVVQITAVDPDQNQAFVSPPLQHTYGTPSVLTVYAPSYDVTGRVLRTGDTILVPVNTGRSGTSLDRNLQTLSAARLYGDDVALSAQGAFLVTEGDLQRTSGLKNLTQALRHRYATPQGSLPYHPQYGCGLDNFLGLTRQPWFDLLVAVEARRTALRDPRIARVTSMTAEAQGDTMSLEFSAITTDEEQFPSTRVTVPLRQVS